MELGHVRMNDISLCVQLKLVTDHNARYSNLRTVYYVYAD
jgi:hypothetical protein